MKGKTTMTITLGLVCLILTAVIFMQFKTISRIDVTALENMQETELRSEITSWKTKCEDIEGKLEKTNEKIAEYNENITNNQKTSELLSNELNQLTGILGERDVSGNGIIVTISDTENKKVGAEDLISLLNELKMAGAEAISINDERIVYESYVVDLGNGFVSVNGVRIVTPYVVKVIGNPTYLESGLSKKQYGYIDTKKSEGLDITLQRQDSIYINKYSRDLNFEKVEE